MTGRPTVNAITDQSILFTGQQYDANAGFYYLRARYYQPINGRFITRDLWPGFNIEPLSQNSYLYAHSDPVNNSDPGGYFVGLPGQALKESTMLYIRTGLAIRTIPAMHALSAAALFTGMAVGVAIYAFNAEDDNDEEYRLRIQVQRNNNLSNVYGTNTVINKWGDGPVRKTQAILAVYYAVDMAEQNKEFKKNKKLTSSLQNAKSLMIAHISKVKGSLKTVQLSAIKVSFPHEFSPKSTHRIDLDNFHPFNLSSW